MLSGQNTYLKIIFIMKRNVFQNCIFLFSFVCIGVFIIFNEGTKNRDNIHHVLKDDFHNFEVSYTGHNLRKENDRMSTNVIT